MRIYTLLTVDWSHYGSIETTHAHSTHSEGVNSVDWEEAHPIRRHRSGKCLSSIYRISFPIKWYSNHMCVLRMYLYNTICIYGNGMHNVGIGASVVGWVGWRSTLAGSNTHIDHPVKTPVLFRSATINNVTYWFSQRGKLYTFFFRYSLVVHIYI